MKARYPVISILCLVALVTLAAVAPPPGSLMPTLVPRKGKPAPPPSLLICWTAPPTVFQGDAIDWNIGNLLFEGTDSNCFDHTNILWPLTNRWSTTQGYGCRPRYFALATFTALGAVSSNGFIGSYMKSNWLALDHLTNGQDRIRFMFGPSNWSVLTSTDLSSWTTVTNLITNNLGDSNNVVDIRVVSPLPSPVFYRLRIPL